MKTAIIIPAHNEEKTVQKVVKQAQKHGLVIVVDDGSTDKTAQKAKEAGATVLSHIVNLGKGAALKTGCDYALKSGVLQIVAIDADAQHDPKLIPTFIKALEKNNIVFGYRTFSSAMPGIFRFGNGAINKVAKILYGIKLNDTQCGYRSFTSATYKILRWRSHDYSVESEMVAKVGKHKLKYAEIPIKTIYQDKYKGTTIFDGIKIVLKMIWWKVS
jgi:UDP-N-acetylglucosamine---dolichyl-phosphate N-acetylglucosaminyltransferase